MISPPPIPTRTDPPLPSTTLFRSRRHPHLDARSPPRAPRSECVIAYRQSASSSIYRSGDLLLFFPLSRVSLQLTSLFRSEEHTSELQSLLRISYAVFCLKKTTEHTSPHMTQSSNP